MCALLGPLLTVSAVQTDHEEHLDVMLRAFPRGVNEAVLALRKAL
jgi:hypothetical protein